jgi:hypothetical protein
VCTRIIFNLKNRMELNSICFDFCWGSVDYILPAATEDQISILLKVIRAPTCFETSISLRNTTFKEMFRLANEILTVGDRLLDIRFRFILKQYQ